MSVGWRSPGGLRNEDSFQCISKRGCIRKGPRRVECHQALRMLDMADCTHSHVIMVLGGGTVRIWVVLRSLAVCKITRWDTGKCVF